MYCMYVCITSSLAAQTKIMANKTYIELSLATNNSESFFSKYEPVLLFVLVIMKIF